MEHAAPRDYDLTWGDVDSATAGQTYEQAIRTLMTRFWLERETAEVWVKHLRKLRKSAGEPVQGVKRQTAQR